MARTILAEKLCFPLGSLGVYTHYVSNPGTIIETLKMAQANNSLYKLGNIDLWRRYLAFRGFELPSLPEIPESNEPLAGDIFIFCVPKTHPSHIDHTFESKHLLAISEVIFPSEVMFPTVYYVPELQED